MACIINNINNISIINNCDFVVPGVSELYIANYTDELYNSLVINNGIISGINSGIRFNVVKFNKTNTKYSESYNYTDKKYEQVFDLDIPRFDYDKSTVIDSLIKAKLIFIFKDNHGKYFMLGEKSGIYSNSYSAGTDSSTGRSIYLFKFITKSDYGILGVSSAVVTAQTTEDCSILDTELALSSSLFINEYGDCIVGNLPSFVDPSIIIPVGPTGSPVPSGPSYSISPSDYDKWIKYTENWTKNEIYFSNDIFMVDYNIGYMVGRKLYNGGLDSVGIVYKTTDGGNTWIDISNPSWLKTDTTDLSSVYFSSATTGFVVGQVASIGVIFKTTDGGSTWTNYVGSWNSSNVAAFNCIKMVNSSLGFVVGYDILNTGVIFKTTDAGVTWTKYTETWVSTEVKQFYSIDMYDVNNGYAVGFDSANTGVIYSTSDGGSSWIKYSDSWTSSDVQTLKGIDIVNSTTAYAVGGDGSINGVILKTTNNGTNWSKYSMPLYTTAYLESIYMISSTIGYCVGGDGYSGCVMKTIDSGITWTKYSDTWINTDVNLLTSISFIGNVGYMVGYDLSPSPGSGVLFRFIPTP